MVQADSSRKVNQFRLPFVWGLVLTLLTLNLLVWGMAYLSLQNSKQQYESRATTAAQNINLLLEQSIQDTFEKVELSVLAVGDSIKRQMMSNGGIDKAFLNTRIAEVHSRLQGVDGLRVTDAVGVVRYGTNVAEGSSINIAEDDQFPYLRDHPDAGTITSKPKFGKISKKWTIKLVRRYNYSDGSFAGLISGIIDLEYFTQLFTGLDIGSNGFIVLRDGEMGILVRYPESTTLGKAIGINNLAPEFLASLRVNPDMGSFSGTSPLDGIHRNVTYHKVGKWPLFVQVGLSTDDYLFEWWREARNTLLAILIFTIFSCLMAWMFWINWRGRARAQVAISYENQRNKALMDAASEGIHIIDLNGILVQANTSFCRMLGYTHDEMKAMHVLQWDAKWSEAAMKRRLEKLKNKTLIFETKHRRRDGSTIDVEINAVGVEIDGQALFYCSSRDITERKTFESKLQQSEAHFRFVSESAQAMIWLSGHDKLCTWFNKVWLDFTGRTQEQEYGNGWVEGVHPDDVARCWEIYSGSFDLRKPFSMEYRLRRHDGEYRWLLDIGKPHYDNEENFTGYIGSCFDITERKHTEDTLRDNHETLESILATTMDGFWSVDEQGNLLDVNPAYCNMSGYTHEELVNMRISDLEAAMSISQIEDQIRHSFRYGRDQFETKHRRKNGTVWDVEVSITYRDILGGRLFVFMRDISERKKFQEELLEIATTDDLTGVINRRHFIELAQNEHRRAIRLHHDLAVALIDIDHFKQINDTHGHAAGDRVLQILAQVFQNSIREIDVFARLGGDEFVLLLPGANTEQAYEVVERARLALTSQKIYFGDQSVSITVSSGIASVSTEEDTFELLMSRADHAMYQSKEAGRNRVTIE